MKVDVKLALLLKIKPLVYKILKTCWEKENSFLIVKGIYALSQMARSNTNGTKIWPVNCFYGKSSTISKKTCQHLGLLFQFITKKK